MYCFLLPLKTMLHCHLCSLHKDQRPMSSTVDYGKKLCLHCNCILAEDISISRWIISGFLSGMPPMSGLIAQGPEKNINKAGSIHEIRIHRLTWQILYYVIFVSQLVPFIFLLFIGASLIVMVISRFVFSSHDIYHRRHVSEISQTQISVPNY